MSRAGGQVVVSRRSNNNCVECEVRTEDVSSAGTQSACLFVRRSARPGVGSYHHQTDSIITSSPITPDRIDVTRQARNETSQRGLAAAKLTTHNNVRMNSRTLFLQLTVQSTGPLDCCLLVALSAVVHGE